MNRDAAGIHPGTDVLVRAIDGELNEAEMSRTREHLACCSACNGLFQELQHLSFDLEAVVDSLPAGASFAERRSILRQIESHALSGSHRDEADRNAAFIFRRFGWSVALAATLAFGVIIAPHGQKTSAVQTPAAHTLTSSLDVDGESFIPLPYSNPDLPLNSSRIVQMQVPVSSLSDAGIVFEPVANGYRTEDRTVLADVLIGVDGQPLGVHILGVE
ncbi:MAG: zf-HC2 domain-containing protein [Acidobacteriaceae bacterium]|nr:zf-HC2 domain-containing protein [Acidobacteriaceae bacterium]MBV8569294.1 zf-HC2 domain-containing protein [Acidobacteriaceae bacterium]